MAYRYDQNPNTEEIEIVIDGWEDGIGLSPHKGLANIQAANISTEEGEIMCSFNRVKQSQTSGSGTLTQINTNTVSVSGMTLLAGSWITITSAGTTGLSGNYYYLGSGKLSAAFSQSASTIVTGITSGTAAFSILSVLGSPIMSATEPYIASNSQQYRYYILDSLGAVWIRDTSTLSGVDTPLWFQSELAPTLSGRIPSGLAVLNGWLSIALGNTFYWKSTSTLGASFAATTSSPASGYPSPLMTSKFHATLVGHQGKMYYTDGNYVGSIFPNTSLLTGAANIQSYASYTAVSTVGTFVNVIGGSKPTTAIDSTRIPAYFFTSTGGTLPTAITSISTIYYILNDGGSTFTVFAAASGGSAIDLQTGATGTQYFNTFNPTATNGFATYTFTPQRLNLPFFETAQCMAEVGNIVIIGASSNTLYPWDQVSALPNDIIPLPENNTVQLLTVNNVAYAFTGQKGNIYITNGSSASLVLKVPDYCAGIAGTPLSYIEPYFTWGGSMYVRGRVWFSILDETSAKSGNCGGIWSFVPSQNFSQNQDTGLSLRLENQSSYATYGGVSNVLLASQSQTAISPQYWSGWYSSISNPTYGIDFTDTISTPNAVIETDLIPTGTALEKKTFKQIEYKLSAPLAAGESVSISYRQNGNAAYATCGSAIVESSTSLSGYFTVPFEKGQWLQLQVTLAPLASSSSSFVRLREIRIR